MAIYHLHIKNISRGDGRSIVAAAAYRAGETLPNDAEERMSAFGGRRDVVMCEIRLPQHAPEWMGDRAKLWNAVEAAERRKDARLAKELEFSLPRELPKASWPAIARQMADAYTSQGFVADLAIHDDGTRHNPHVHLLITTRVVTPQGFGPKIRSADGLRFVTDARALWADVANNALAKAGIATAIDNRSHAERELEQRPGQHRGPDPLERRARRERLKQEREPMSSTIEDRELPVPDPDGRPIHPDELAKAEERMLEDLHAPAEAEIAYEGTSDIARAEEAIERQNEREVNDDQAATYRLAPDNHLDWLNGEVSADRTDTDVLDCWENHLDWLDADALQPNVTADEAPSHEPDRT